MNTANTAMAHGTEQNAARSLCERLYHVAAGEEYSWAPEQVYAPTSQTGTQITKLL